MSGFDHMWLYHKPLIELAKLIFSYMTKCDIELHWNVHTCENSINHNFTYRCTMKTNDTSFWSLHHKVSKFTIKQNWSGAYFTSGLWWMVTYDQTSVPKGPDIFTFFDLWPLIIGRTTTKIAGTLTGHPYYHPSKLYRRTPYHLRVTSPDGRKDGRKHGQPGNIMPLTYGAEA